MRRETTYRRVSGDVDFGRALQVLADFGERVAVEPGNLEAASREMLAELRGLLGLGCMKLRAEISERRGISVETEGENGWWDAEIPIMRGKIRVGSLSARTTQTGIAPGEEQLRGLRAAASHLALAVDAAHARESAAMRAVHGSVVQLASEALGKILEEDRLYKTVLVLTLELMDASGAAALLEDGSVTGVGEFKEGLDALGEVAFPTRKPWIGRIADRHAVGVPVGRGGGALFLFRKEWPYLAWEGVSLKLVARQLDRARERSRMYAEREKTNLDAVAALAASLEMRDSTTGEHIHRAQGLAVEVAGALGLEPERLRTMRYAAVLHDIGKVGIPDAILNKPGKLDEAEWAFMRRHPKIGADIISRIGGFESVAAVVLAHHERHDGQGYPARMAGQEIPVEARIISVIDAYDAMTNDRPYRNGMSPEEAIAELDACSGRQFDPEVVEALKAVLIDRGREDD
ncbi:MAG: HD-GYP domain-containing protein [Rubrobacter sp.]|jgi:HD-GYP domain-containing protein (c-di-GMP phosphodiesterase class II)|nr:HD-GYP domain-containing protein [Rubrobacter sp.]